MAAVQVWMGHLLEKRSTPSAVKVGDKVWLDSKHPPVDIRIPAKKWGDTKIAQRGRSVLVMCARYRSAGLTLHQRGWMDAGWTVSRLQLCNGPL